MKKRSTKKKNIRWDTHRHVQLFDQTKTIKESNTIYNKIKSEPMPDFFLPKKKTTPISSPSVKKSSTTSSSSPSLSTPTVVKKISKKSPPKKIISCQIK